MQTETLQPDQETAAAVALDALAREFPADILAIDGLLELMKAIIERAVSANVPEGAQQPPAHSTRVIALIDDMLAEHANPAEIFTEEGLLKLTRTVIERALALREPLGGGPKPTVQALLDQYVAAITTMDYYNVPVATWDEEYRSDRWDYLNNLNQTPRYAVIAGYARRLRPDCSILDIGCGEGGLLRQLKGGYSHYIGMDISEAAIERALPRQDEHTEFLVADAETYVPNRAFDVIVFNECLYHFPPSLNILRRYADFLNPGGVFIVSMYGGPVPTRIWERLEPLCEVLDYVQLTNDTGVQCTIKLLAPPRD